MRLATAAGILCLGAASLLGCAAEKPLETVQTTADGITIRGDANNPQLAGVRADEYCSRSGKFSRLVEATKAGGLAAVEHPGTALFVFSCVDRPVSQ